MIAVDVIGMGEAPCHGVMLFVLCFQLYRGARHSRLDTAVRALARGVALDGPEGLGLDGDGRREGKASCHEMLLSYFFLRTVLRPLVRMGEGWTRFDSEYLRRFGAWRLKSTHPKP